MTTTTTRLADRQAAHADLRARYHAIDAEIADLMDACHRGEVAEDAAWYAAVDALVAEQDEVAAAEEAMRPEIHQLTREQVEVLVSRGSVDRAVEVGAECVSSTTMQVQRKRESAMNFAAVRSGCGARGLIGQVSVQVVVVGPGGTRPPGGRRSS